MNVSVVSVGCFVVVDVVAVVSLTAVHVWLLLFGCYLVAVPAAVHLIKWMKYHSGFGIPSMSSSTL